MDGTAEFTVFPSCGAADGFVLRYADVPSREKQRVPGESARRAAGKCGMDGCFLSVFCVCGERFGVQHYFRAGICGGACDAVDLRLCEHHFFGGSPEQNAVRKRPEVKICIFCCFFTSIIT